MPPLSGFSDNPFVSRNDAVTATRALIEPLVPYFSQGKARINIPLTSGAHFDGAAAQLEGYGRPLWAVAALLSGQGEHGPSDAISQQLLKNWIEGLENGVNPLHAEYWGPIGDWDQRMVEAEVISFALLAVPEILYTPLSADAKGNLQSWLEGMNGKVMPENNWRWFRVFTNLALIKVCGASEEVHWPIMKQDLKVLDSFVIGDGWSSDGVWKPHDMDETGKHTAENAGRSRQADYYSGSFAIQFSQMLYCKFASDLDPERCQRFREGINDFCRTYWTFFDIDGKSIFSVAQRHRFANYEQEQQFRLGGRWHTNSQWEHTTPPLRIAASATTPTSLLLPGPSRACFCATCAGGRQTRRTSSGQTARSTSATSIPTCT